MVFIVSYSNAFILGVLISEFSEISHWTGRNLTLTSNVSWIYIREHDEHNECRCLPLSRLFCIRSVFLGDAEIIVDTDDAASPAQMMRERAARSQIIGSV